MTLTRIDHDWLVAETRATAQEEILPRFRQLEHGDIQQKTSANDLVTQADLCAEARLSAALHARYPGALIVGEEACAADPGLRSRIHEAELAFIIDPVDGTWNFAHDLPLFGVILAATRFGVPIFGLLYDPIADDWIIAGQDRPTEQITANGSARRLCVSKGGALSDLSGYLHLFLMSPAHQAATAPLLPKLGRAYALRCSCHEYRTLARGSMDFCLSGTLNPWDHAAGVLACQMAGGTVRMLDGQPYSTEIETGYLLAAANEDSWCAIRDLLAPVLV